MTSTPDGVDWHRLLTAARDHALAYQQALEREPVRAAASADDMLERLALLGGMPREGRAPPEVLEELVALARPGLTAMSGPRFFGWVTGGALPAALAADWMTTTWDQNAGPATGAPAACAFELVALAWLVELLQLPAEAKGALVTGGTLANFSALAAARSQVLESVGWNVERDGLFGAPPVRVMVGRERHDSIDKALRLLGFGKRSLAVVEADAQGRLSTAALRRELETTPGPAIVCAQAGNVNSGAFDPLVEVHAAAEEHRARSGAPVWLHLDGAFGLWARASSAHAALAAGAELMDSWAADAHKLLNVPYDSGIVLTRHPRAHRRAMAIQGAYLASGNPGPAAPPGVFTPELSRRARGFALWAALRQLGAQGVDALVTRAVTHAQRLAAELGAAPGLSTVNDVVFNQIVIRAAPPKGRDAAEFTRELVTAIQHEGTCFPTPTLWRGAPGLRFSVVNWSTSDADIIRSAAAVRGIYAELCR